MIPYNFSGNESQIKQNKHGDDGWSETVINIMLNCGYHVIVLQKLEVPINLVEYIVFKN